MTVYQRHILHQYVSAYCQHEQHDDCRLTCKFCEVSCLCRCHGAFTQRWATGLSDHPEDVGRGST